MGRRTKRPERPSGPGGLFFFCSIWLAGLAGATAGFLLDQGYAQHAAPASSPAETAATSAVVPHPPRILNLLPRLDHPLNVLFMATDVDYVLRQGKQVLGLRGNTDTMILMRLDPQHGQVRLLSIPRDTRVPIPGHGTFKINAANPYGGPKLAEQVVGTFLGVPIDRYLVINTQGVIQVVDALGGVNLYVPHVMNYDDNSGKLHIHLDKGWNFLDGRHAHDFLRFRHDDLGDIGRVQRQQSFMQALMGQYMTPLNLLKTPKLLAVAKDNMATDLSTTELLSIVGWAKDLDRSKVTQAMVPGHEAIIRRGWYWDPEVAQTHALVQTFLLGAATPAAIPAAQTHVALEDGVGDSRALERLRLALLHAGYTSVEVEGRADQLGRDLTEVIAQNADAQGAQALAAAIGLGHVLVASTGVLGMDLTVVMGRDWVRGAEVVVPVKPSPTPRGSPTPLPP